MRSILRRGLAAASEFGDSLARVAGHRFINTRDLGIAYGEELLRRSLRFLDIDMVFDVGANRGQYATQLRRRIDYRGLLVSIEPLPAPAAHLRWASRNDPNWEVRQCAIAEGQGAVVMNVMANDQFSSLLTPEVKFEGKFGGELRIVGAHAVPAVSLNQAVNDAQPFRRGLLKLDTQGTELQILRAGHDALTRFRAVQVEVGFVRLYDGEASYEELRQAMAELSFSLCGLFPNNRGHFPHLFEMDALFIKDEFLTKLA